jgi:hypothetical protein
MATLVSLFCLSFVSQAGANSASGSITGTVAPGSPVAAVFAIDRSTGKKLAGKSDSATGQFRFDDLPLDKSFDVLIDFKPAANSGLTVWRLEGVSMKVPRSDYEEEQPLMADDVATIKEKVLSLNQFEDAVEILAIDGNIQHAAVLVNKRRTKPFYESKPGEIIWRPELWHFERPEETWVKVQDELFIILYRERIQRAEFDKRSVTFTSALGGVRVTIASPSVDLGKVEPPEPKPGVRYRGAGDLTRSQ